MTWTPTHWKQAQEAWKTSWSFYQRLRKAGLKVVTRETALTTILAKNIQEDIDNEILKDLKASHDMFSVLPALRPASLWCPDRLLWMPPERPNHDVLVVPSLILQSGNLLHRVQSLPPLRFDLCQCGVCSSGATASKGWPEDCPKGVQFPKRDHEPIWGQDGQTGVFWSS